MSDTPPHLTSPLDHARDAGPVDMLNMIVRLTEERDALSARVVELEARESRWLDAEPSEQRQKYEATAARVAVGKASQDEAASAILALCKHNERLAVLAGEARAEAAEAKMALYQEYFEADEAFNNADRVSSLEMVGRVIAARAAIRAMKGGT